MSWVRRMKRGGWLQDILWEASISVLFPWTILTPKVHQERVKGVIKQEYLYSPHHWPIEDVIEIDLQLPNAWVASFTHWNRSSNNAHNCCQEGRIGGTILDRLERGRANTSSDRLEHRNVLFFCGMNTGITGSITIANKHAGAYRWPFRLGLPKEFIKHDENSITHINTGIYRSDHNKVCGLHM